MAAAPALTSTVAAASTSNQPNEVLTQNIVDRINPYVEVKNTQYVLNDEAKNVITSSEYNSAKAQIASANQFISESSLVINQTTKNASLEFEVIDSGKSVRVLPPSTQNSGLQKSGLQTRSRYHYGVNKVKVDWSYIRVYLDKELVKAALTGSVTGIAGLISYTTGSAGVAVTASAIGAFINSLITGQVKGGLWFDLNWIYTAMWSMPVITAWGW